MDPARSRRPSGTRLLALDDPRLAFDPDPARALDYLRALIPGVDASQLDVSVVNRTLTVSGMRRSADEEGVSYHRRERPEGAFSRSVTLPADFEGARVEARYLDGILTLTLPKPEAAKPRRVTVQTA